MNESCPNKWATNTSPMGGIGLVYLNEFWAFFFVKLAHITALHFLGFPQISDHGGVCSFSSNGNKMENKIREK